MLSHSIIPLLKRHRLLSLSTILLFLIILLFLVSTLFQKIIENDWTEIKNEKNMEITKECSNLFESVQNSTYQYAKDITNSRRFISIFESQNTRKNYEFILSLPDNRDYNIEVFNSRMELYLFSGRQIYPDITNLKRALQDEEFSVVKTVGFYTYIVVFIPIKTYYEVNDKQSTVTGVLVVSKMIDLFYGFKSMFYRNSGITQDIFKKFSINVEFDFKNQTKLFNEDDTAFAREQSISDLTSIDNKIIGKVYIPYLDKTSYLGNVKKNFDDVIKILLFFLYGCLILLLYSYFRKKLNNFLSTILFIILLTISRYFLLFIGFPSGLLHSLGCDFLSPVYYASDFCFGIIRSVGKLAETTIFLFLIIMVISFYLFRYMKDKMRNSEQHSKFNYMGLIFAMIIFFGSLLLYWEIIQNIVYDSNVKFFERSQILPMDNPEVIILELSILLISLSEILLLFTCIFYSALSIRLLTNKRLVIRYSFLLVSSLLLSFSVLLKIIFIPNQDLKLNLILLILFSVLIPSYFIYQKFLLDKSYQIFNFINFSILLLIGAFITPIIMLDNISSQEDKYLEQQIRSISKHTDEEIKFLILSSLDDITDREDLESYLRDKYRAPRLAFDLWAESRLYAEELNSAVFILDTNKNIISEFNINPAELHSDSIVSFTLKNYALSDSLSSETDEESIDDEFVYSENIYQDKEMKFFSSIQQIENPVLKSSEFNNILGYIIIAVHYDTKNFLTRSGFEIFRNSKRDNIINKFTSTPVYTEFSDEEITGSTDNDISKTLVKSLNPFRDLVKDKTDKAAFRYDEVEGEVYKSYYILDTEQKTGPEKIYVISLRINDLSQYIFFVFKFLIFTILCYSLILIIYFLINLFQFVFNKEKRAEFYFGFREKLFVSFLIVSVIPIIFLALYTRELVVTKNKERYNQQMLSELKLVEQYIKTKVPMLDLQRFFKPKSTLEMYNAQEIFDRSFSKSEKNFNLFVKTKLISTTNEELYKSDLLDLRISGNAYYNIALLKKDYFWEEQEIGNFTFLVGYKPIYDKFNNLAGILSTQTLFNQSAINQELTESLVYIFGTYFIAVLFLIVIVNFLSYRISNPIIQLQKATERISKGDVDITIRTKSKDEIGELVKSFNKMTKEIKRSRAELKKAERETAWRDIARQVAHEIKNPLTPMKLAIQHLYHAYTHSSKDFKTIIQTTNHLIVEQIEVLNRIATEFSDFAKMPSRNYVKLNMEQTILDVVKLLNTDNKIITNLIKHKSSQCVLGDKDEMKRVLINLLRNSLQAIDEKTTNVKDGKIFIETFVEDSQYIIKITDNGIGMDEDTLRKLFEPYFSTKSSGMGLGLVITKKIIDDMKGKILIDSKMNSGTTVILNFPLTSQDVNSD